MGFLSFTLGKVYQHMKIAFLANLGGHFCHCDGKGINLQLTRSVPLVGQLSLYLMTLIVNVVNKR